jgi:hypothetical protein
MAAALAHAVAGSTELRAHSFEQLTRATGLLLDRAVAAGDLRSDIQPENPVRALVDMCYMHDQPGWQTTVVRLMDILVDGLRVPLQICKQNAAEVVKRRRSKRD